MRNICLVTNVKNDFCEIEHTSWIHKNNLIKLEKGPNGEDLGVPYYVEATGKGKVVIIPIPGYHALSKQSKDSNGCYFIFSLYDPSPWRDSDLGIVPNIEWANSFCNFYNPID